MPRALYCGNVGGNVMRLTNIATSYVYAAKYGIYHTVKRQYGVNTQPRPFKLMVSLTSYPARIKVVYLTVESLLNQTFKPDKIILWLSKSEIEPDTLPSSLTKLQSRGLEIRLVEENIKSYKKLVYAVEQFSDYHIVTCDDDVMFPKWFLEGLYHSYQKYPNCISTYRYRVMSKINARKLSPYIDWPLANRTIPNTDRPSYTIFPNGGCGIWYPPHSLDKRISDRLFMKLAPNGDDIWFKAMSLLAQTKTVAVRMKNVEFPFTYARKTQAKTLWQTNITENDQQLKAVFDYFNLYDFIY